MDAFNTMLVDEKDKAIPKKKFTFKRKEGAKKKEKKEEETNESKNNFLSNNALGNHFSLKSIYGKEIKINEAELLGKENVIIDDLEGCIIHLPVLIKSLYIKNLKDCKLMVGCVSGATFVRAAINSEVHVQSHQIRIHDSKNA